MSHDIKTGRFITMLLRHKPPRSMDSNGWVPVGTIINLVNEQRNLGWNGEFKLNDLENIVKTNDKKRYVLDESKEHIRASQGHTIDVDVELKQVVPPEILYHGTALQSVEIIKKQGLNKMKRNHVHMTANHDTAVKVGSRHGKPFIFKVLAKKMHDEGFIFYLSENGVWLTEVVLPQYLEENI